MRIIYTHSEDCDGFFSAQILKYYIKNIQFELCEIIPLNYTELDKIPAEGDYFITDLNLKLGHPALNNKDCIIFDHHIWQGMPESKNGIISTEFCATKLVVNNYFKGDFGVELLADIIDAADRFQENNPYFKTGRDLNAIFNLVGGFYGMEKLMNSIPNNLFGFFNTLGELSTSLYSYKSIINREQIIANQIAEESLIIEPKYTLCLSSGGDRSSIGHDLVRKYNLPNIQLINIYENGKIRKQLTIRSENGEAREIALKLGGGGHPNAAGVNFSDKFPEKNTLVEINEQIKKLL